MSATYQGPVEHYTCCNYLNLLVSLLGRPESNRVQGVAIFCLMHERFSTHASATRLLAAKTRQPVPHPIADGTRFATALSSPNSIRLFPAARLKTDNSMQTKAERLP